jgi:hypothetical protein
VFRIEEKKKLPKFNEKAVEPLITIVLPSQTQKLEDFNEMTWTKLSFPILAVSLRR